MSHIMRFCEKCNKRTPHSIMNNTCIDCHIQDSKPGADRVARVAGIWRPIEMSDGDILKLFQSGKQGEKNYRQFDGKWYVLDESLEAQAEARQEYQIKFMQGVIEKHQIRLMEYGNEIDRLTAENERLRRELKDLKESYYPPRKKNEN